MWQWRIRTVRNGFKVCSLLSFLIMFILKDVDSKNATVKYKKYANQQQVARKYGYRWTRAPKTFATTYQLLKQMNQRTKQQFLFIKRLTTIIIRGINKLHYDHVKVRDYVSADVLMTSGRGQNLSHIYCDWRYLNVTHYEGKKVYDIHLLLKDFLLTFEVYQREGRGALVQSGFVTVLVPFSVFRVRLTLLKIDPNGKYIPQVDDLTYHTKGKEQVHYTLFPKKADRYNMQYYSEVKDKVRMMALHHYRVTVMPVLEELMYQLINQVLEGILVPLPRIPIHKEDNFHQFNADDYYVQRQRLPHFQRKNPRRKPNMVAQKVSTEMYDIKSGDIYE